MATLTTNISNVSLTVSGNTTQTATISWTCPTVPAGSTITSCKLTGTATASMSKGSATIKVNGTTVSSGSNFTINLGTANTTSSVSATAVGGNKNAKGTVTLSNLVYTVEYTEPVVTYIVTFKDWDGSVLKTEEIESGSAATAPSNPSREGYEFIGWDKTFSNITSDLTVTAQYSIKTYTVRFYSDSTFLKTETVEHGKSATAPNSPIKEGHTFTGWDKDFTNITSDLSVYALYEINKYTVTFVDYDGTILKTEEVEYGSSATAPEVSREGYELTSWSVDFTNVTSDITTAAQYVAVDILKIKENGNWINISKVYKRVLGNWVEQINNDWDEIFDINTKYAKLRFPNPTAILYEDGTFIFSNYDDINTSHGNVIETYTGWHEVEYNFGEAPWYNNKDLIKEVYLNNVETFSTLYWFYSNRFLQSVSGSGFRNTLDMKGMFSYCSSLTSLDISNFDTSNVTSMESMFSGCSSLTSLDLSNFDTSNVTNIINMFSYCSSLTSLDVSSFDTNNVTNMSAIFDGCSSLTSLDLSNFDTSNITSMNSMFNDCSSLTSLDVSSFDTSNVTNMGWMFGNCSNLIIVDLSNFDISKVTSISYMFRGCTSLQTIYVKDETAKTKIEASTGFPTGVSVIIGKPN